MNKLNRIPNIVLIVIAAISVVLIVLLVSNVDPDTQNVNMGNWITINLRWMYILLFFAVILLVLFAVYQIVTEWQSAKGGLLYSGAFAVMVVIAYLLASGEIPTFFGVEKFIADGTITPVKLKIIDTALFSTYFMFGLAIIALIYSSVTRYFK